MTWDLFCDDAEPSDHELMNLFFRNPVPPDRAVHAVPADAILLLMDDKLVDGNFKSFKNNPCFSKKEKHNN